MLPRPCFFIKDAISSFLFLLTLSPYSAVTAANCWSVNVTKPSYTFTTLLPDWPSPGGVIPNAEISSSSGSSSDSAPSIRFGLGETGSSATTLIDNPNTNDMQSNTVVNLLSIVNYSSL